MRARAAFVLLLAALAGASAGGVVVVADALGEDRERAAAAGYLREVSRVCEFYGEELDLIPPPDASSPGSIYETVGSVIPIVQAEIDEVRAIRPPRGLEREVRRFVELSDRAVAALRVVRAEAEQRDLWGSAQAFSRFEEARNRAQAQGRRVGFPC